MHIWDAPGHRVLCAEPLEGRWFLSGLGASSERDDGGGGGGASADLQNAPSDSAGVRVIEFGPLEEEETEDIPVAPTDLPKAVLAAMHARFPGAELLEAERDSEDGETEFSVNARFGGRLIEVTFSPRGRIIETEETLSSNELPQAALDWIRQAFPGAQIEEAAVMIEDGETSYEVQIEAPDGTQYEATLQVSDALAPAPVQTDDVIELSAMPGDARADATAEHATGQTPSDRSQRTSDDQAAHATREPAPEEAADQQTPAGGNGEDPSEQLESQDPARAEGAAVAALIEPGFLEKAIATIIDAGVAPIVWLPEVAASLGEVLDVAAIERQFQHILDEIDALAANAVGESTASSIAWRISAVAAIIAGAQLLRIDSSKPVPRLCWSFGRPTPLGVGSVGRRARRLDGLVTNRRWGEQ